eukprot:GFUD01035542.1.p1 GENE.GFUD01035542.1~~GFUD01035542.1.p1  ORF type:complete len:213 (+),score=49.19 GFUD01035542.1:98-736(+)
MSFSLGKGCHHMQLISYFNRLQRGQYMARSRFHTSTCCHSDWIDQQRQAMRMQEDRKSQMVARREKEKLEEVRIQEEQEEAMRNEIRAREKSMPKDKLDEAYFKDKKRFNIKDRRDPIHSGSKEDDGDWRSYISQSMKESQEMLSKIKESQPLTFTQAAMSGGRFGYHTFSFGHWLVGGGGLLFLLLLWMELRAQYQENCEEKEMLRSLREK